MFKFLIVYKKKKVYTASIDLKGAFYSVHVHKNHQAYLTFFVEEYLKFVCMPNGYGPAMRIFTKISKIPFSIFREKGFLSVAMLMTYTSKVMIMRIASLMF